MSSMPLSELLRTATRSAHEHAETRSFVTELMSGQLDRNAHIDLTAQLFPVYEALEDLADTFADDELVQPFLIPALVRLPSLEADLTALVGADWREQTSLVPSTEVYTNRLRSIDSAPMYVAHAYTRYLGDLSGGQIISRMLERHYGMGKHELNFYTFTEIPKLKVFKDEYRALLDAAPFTAAQREEAVAEAKVAFDLNAALFMDLGARHEAQDPVSV